MKSAWIILLLCSSAFAQHTYYISKSTGSDSNTSTQARSKSTPWAHLPGMASCTSNCSSYSPVAGDSFILMGCDVWVNSDLPVSWNGWSGTSGNVIYVGVDKTWYNTTNCPSAWNRPVFNAGKTVISGNNYFINPISGADPSYVTFDNIEFKELEITSSASGGVLYDWGETSVGDSFINNYIHAWDASADNCVLLNGPYEPTTGTGFLYEYNVIDGSDRTGSGDSGSSGACYAFYQNYTGAKIINNVIQYVVNPIVAYTNSSSTTLEIGGNLLAFGLNSIAGANHCNMIETVGSGKMYIHDNLMHDLECSGGENMMIGNSGETDYVWNNVIYNVGSSQTPSGPQNSGQTGISLYFWNNTVVDPNGTGCFFYSGQGGDQYNVINFQHNHCISGAASALGSGFNVTSLTNANNTLMTSSTATADGYTSSQTYVYSPTSGTKPTVGAGINLTSSWPSGFATSDTSYGCTEQTTSGVVQVSCPGRTANARPSSGAWDAGAYEFTTASSPAVIQGGVKISGGVLIGAVQVLTPTLSQAAGTVSAGTATTASDGTSGAYIWYTTDGTTPSYSKDLNNGQYYPATTSTELYRSGDYPSGFTLYASKTIKLLASSPGTDRTLQPMAAASSPALLTILNMRR